MASLSSVASEPNRDSQPEAGVDAALGGAFNSNGESNAGETSPQVSASSSAEEHYDPSFKAEDFYSWVFEENSVVPTKGEPDKFTDTPEILSFDDAYYGSMKLLFSGLPNEGSENKEFKKLVPAFSDKFGTIYGNVVLSVEAETSLKFNMDYEKIFTKLNQAIDDICEFGGLRNKNDNMRLQSMREVPAHLLKFSKAVQRTSLAYVILPRSHLVNKLCRWAYDNVWLEEQSDQHPITLTSSNWTQIPGLYEPALYDTTTDKFFNIKNMVSAFKFLQTHDGHRFRMIERQEGGILHDMIKISTQRLYADGLGNVLSCVFEKGIVDYLSLIDKMKDKSFEAGHAKGLKDSQSVADEGEEKLHQKTLADAISNADVQYQRMVKEKDDLMTTRQNRWEKEIHGLNARIRELESPASESERVQFQEQLAALSEKITRLEGVINTKDDEISRLRLASPPKEKRSKADKWVAPVKKRDRDGEEGGSGSKKPAGKKNKKGK